VRSGHSKAAHVETSDSDLNGASNLLGEVHVGRVIGRYMLAHTRIL
jgi:hypothetical protein